MVVYLVGVADNDCVNIQHSVGMFTDESIECLLVLAYTVYVHGLEV